MNTSGISYIYRTYVIKHMFGEELLQCFAHDIHPSWKKDKTRQLQKLAYQAVLLNTVEVASCPEEQEQAHKSN